MNTLRQLVEAAVEEMTAPFILSELEAKFPGISREMIRKLLAEVRAQIKLPCLACS